jgi:hypothetical protein
LDFIYELESNRILLIELETGIDGASKYEHCTGQIKRYTNLKNRFGKRQVDVVLVYASEGTPEKVQNRLLTFTDEYNVILKTYSITKLLQIYDEMLNRLHRTSGISLGRAVALGITSLSWLNKFMVAFLDGQGNGSPLDSIPWIDLKDMFSSNTSFYVLKRFAEDFEFIELKTDKRTKILELTKNGQQFRDELRVNNQIRPGDPGSLTTDVLTLGQRRLLLEILLNGNFTKIKVNIFHFLRFVHLTEGSWLPRMNTKLTKAEQQYLNNVFRTSYNSRTLKDIIQQTCTFCEELGLLEKLSSPNQVYDMVMFTSLGSRVYNYFEQLLNVERERYQIPQQIKS